MLWAPYLLLRRGVLAGVLVGVVAIGVNLLPELIAAPSAGGTWLERWVKQLVIPSQKLDVALGEWGSELIYNQSLSGTTQRLVNTALEWRDGKVVVVNRSRVAPMTMKLAYFGLIGALLMLSLVSCARASPTPRGAAQVSPAALEFGMVVALILLLSPMSSPAHFGTLVLPGFCLARIAMIERDRLITVLVGVAAGITILCNSDLVGRTVYTTLLWAGAMTTVTLLLWLGCAIALVPRPRSSHHSTAPSSTNFGSEGH